MESLAVAAWTTWAASRSAATGLFRMARSIAAATSSRRAPEPRGSGGWRQVAWRDERTHPFKRLILVSNPVELADLAELFTPRYIVHRLAELVDHNADDMRIARELRHLRPWLDRDRF